MEDNFYAKQFLNVIKKIALNEDRKTKGLTTYYGTIVACYDSLGAVVSECPVDGKCDIRLASYGGIIYDIPNKTNGVLTVNSNVVIIAINDCLSNAYISVKMGG